MPNLKIVLIEKPNLYSTMTTRSPNPLVSSVESNLEDIIRSACSSAACNHQMVDAKMVKKLQHLRIERLE